jgi:hypothetical protein
VTGQSFYLAGGAIVFESKLQLTVASIVTGGELIAAVLVAKIAKYLRSILMELAFPPSGPTLLYEDNKAAINMVNANRRTARSRHIHNQHFANDGTTSYCTSLHTNVCIVHRSAMHAIVLCPLLPRVVIGVDCTNAYANSLSPTQATYVRIDGAYADWYRSRHGIKLDRSLVLPVLTALQGRPEAVALWKSTSTRLLTISISCAPHMSEVSRYRVHHKRAKYLPRLDRRSGRPSVPTSRRPRCRLSRSFCGARFD